MSTTTGSTVDYNGAADQPHRRLTTETKASTKTTELVAFVAVVLAIVVTANLYDGTGNGEGDPFGATTAMRYITWLTIGYMVARGLAKSGSREAYDA